VELSDIFLLEGKVDLKSEVIQDLLSKEKPCFAYLATVMKDGSPQVTPVWFDSDGEYIYINSAKGRTKDRNMRQRPVVSLAISDRENPYRYLQIRGKVVDIYHEGADEHINQLSLRYTGKPWNDSSGALRLIYKIEPVRLDYHS
jgi:PPOX class probable F420-dependent enzyme